MLALNAIPVLGWLLASVVCFFIAVPFYYLWNYLAPIYAYWLPPVYLELPFWHVVGLLWLIIMVKQLLLPNFGTTVNNEKAKS